MNAAILTEVSGSLAYAEIKSVFTMIYNCRDYKVSDLTSTINLDFFQATVHFFLMEKIP